MSSTKVKQKCQNNGKMPSPLELYESKVKNYISIIETTLKEFFNGKTTYTFATLGGYIIMPSPALSEAIKQFNKKNKPIWIVKLISKDYSDSDRRFYLIVNVLTAIKE